MAYTQEQVNTVTQRLEAARRAGTLAQLVGVEEAAKWGNKPISGGAQDLINAFGLSDLEAVYNKGRGAPPPPGVIKAVDDTPHGVVAPPGTKKPPPPPPKPPPAPPKAVPKPVPPPITGLVSAAPTTGGAGGGMATPLANPLAGGGGGGGIGAESATGAQMLNAPNTLRQGIGTRIPPMMSMALAGLQRVY